MQKEALNRRGDERLTSGEESAQASRCHTKKTSVGIAVLRGRVQASTAVDRVIDLLLDKFVW